MTKDTPGREMAGHQGGGDKTAEAPAQEAGLHAGGMEFSAEQIEKIKNDIKQALARLERAETQ